MRVSKEQVDFYQSKGYLILPKVFSLSECDEYRQRIIGLLSGKEKLEGFELQDKYNRTFQQHLYDNKCEEWLIDLRLQEPLETIAGGRVEAMQTMHFIRGSEHRRHQDQYYLPDCFSAWIPLEDVSQKNGTIFVEPGSHEGDFISKQDIPWPVGMDREVQQESIYFPAVEKLSKESGIAPVLVEINKGDVCLFHGKLIHGGITPTQKGSSRHVLACHYIRYDSTAWDRNWPRISFDGSRRVKYRKSDGTVVTE